VTPVDLGLRGRTAIVTGASRGIGRAIADFLAAQGVDLCLMASPSDGAELAEVVRALQDRDVRAFALASDVGLELSAREAVDRTLEAYGRLDCLASNAGIAYLEESLSAPVDHFDETLRVNVRGMYLMAIESARAMAGGKGGAIVCTASTASIAGEERELAYNVSKGAVAALARSLAVDLAPYGIRANAVAPGWVATSLNEGVVTDPARWSKPRARIPMDRAASPAEIAAVVAFLLSDLASYVSGALLVADGGMTAGFRDSDWDARELPIAPRPRRRLPRHTAAEPTT
jgi:L-rhamnose 1-dehydrogenase